MIKKKKIRNVQGVNAVCEHKILKKCEFNITLSPLNVTQTSVMVTF